MQSLQREMMMLRHLVLRSVPLSSSVTTTLASSLQTLTIPLSCIDCSNLQARNTYTENTRAGNDKNRKTSETQFLKLINPDPFARKRMTFIHLPTNGTSGFSPTQRRRRMNLLCGNLESNLSSSRCLSTTTCVQTSLPNSKDKAPDSIFQASNPAQLTEPSVPVDTVCSTVPLDSDAASGLLLYPEFPLIQAAESGLQLLHQTGLQWWGCILLSAVILRGLVMLPLTIHLEHNKLRLEQLVPELKDRMAQLKTEIGISMYKHGWDQKRARLEFIKRRKEILGELYRRDNCHPMKNTASFWYQFPIWVSVSFALRNLTARATSPHLEGHSALTDLTTGGAAWFVDLTLVDSTLILPLMMGAITLFNVELNYLKVTEVTQYRKYLTYFLRGLSLVFIPISAAVPTTMVLYWVGSAFTATALNLLVETTVIRRRLNLPPLPHTAHSLAGRARERYLGR